MRVRWALFALYLAVGFIPQSVVAAPAVPDQSPQAAQSADIPFDPPLDAKVRYRWEQSVERDGKTDMLWSVFDYEFEPIETGYRLTVTPVNSGSNETNPTMIAIMKRIEELTRRPFVLKLNPSGEIEEVVEADKYWSTIFKVMKEEIAKEAATKKDPLFGQVTANMLGMLEKMPADARKALMTEEVQPVVEFADTHTEVGSPIASSIDTPSPFGGVLKRDVTISLAKVADSKAYLTIRSSIPRAELDKLMQAFIKQLTVLPDTKRSEAEKGLTSLKDFRHDTLSDYQVSVEDGLLERFHSTETVIVSDGDKQKVRVTTRTMTQMK